MTDGGTITVPSGSFTWTTGVNFTKAITLQGAGAVSAVGGGSKSNTGSDLTTIIDHHPTPEHKLLGLVVAPGKVARLTGIHFLSDSGTVNTQAGMIQVSGGSNSIRIDHCHFHQSVAIGGGPTTIATYGGANGILTGVFDHNYFDSPLGNGPVAVYLQNGVGTGDAGFSAPDDFGTDKFIFMEDNNWRNGYLGDANTGANRFVYRYNGGTMEFDDNMHISAGYVANHGITGGRGRSTRAWEFYKNNFSALGPIGLNKSPMPVNGGTGVDWGNTITQYRYGITIDYTRKDNSTYPYGTPPTGWGNCNGTTVTVWDGPNGPCLDQPGYGQGDLLSGNFPNIVNTRTGTPARVIQAISPVRIFSNTLNPAGGFSSPQMVGNQAPAVVHDNKEFYQDFGPLGESGTFDGTRGIGKGPVANRPTTCTPGVYWWDSVTETLTQCGPVANTWHVDYHPFTYPHPLASGALKPNVNRISLGRNKVSPTPTPRKVTRN